MVVRTLTYHYHDAPRDVRKAGERWYARAKREARQLAKRYDVSVEQAAAVIAVLSQRQRWQRNLELAEQALAGERVTGIFAHQRVKLELLSMGEPPADVLRGPKITAFYHAIMGDMNSVVLDTWMLDTMNRPQGVTAKQYERLAEMLRAQAADAGVAPAVFQAVVWCQVRGGGE